jgi:hypothetical protein
MRYQLIPLGLTIVVLAILIAILHGSILLLNTLPFTQPIILSIRWYDVLVGMTVYLKTSIDFAILMGRLMAGYPDWRGRVAIEIGTAVGNAAGTIAIIALWVLLKHIDILLAIMIFIAALVLFELAHGSLEQISDWNIAKVLHKLLDPIVRYLPDIGANLNGKTGLSWRGLLGFSMTVPFILGLDDFAGYVPLFSVVNVYGFAIGVMGAHTLLNIALFLSPARTVQAVKNQYVALLGALAFIGLALYGLFEAGKIIAGIVG